MRACRGLAEKGGATASGKFAAVSLEVGRSVCRKFTCAFGKLRLSITNQNHDTAILTPTPATSITLRIRS